MRNKKGVAFLTTIILLGVVIIITTALSIMLLRDAFIVKRLKSSTQAYYLAEAGVEEAIENLWNSDFSTSAFPITRTLGEGSISVALDTSRWSSEDILLITSTGTVKGVARTLKTGVKANIPSSFDYVILANGKIFVTQRSEVNCNAAIGIHSNSPATGGSFGTSAIDVVGFSYDCWVNGNASAVGIARERRHGHITGTKTNNASSVALPSFDADFFDYYYDLANASGDVYTPGGGTQNFTTSLAPANGVIYVNGNVSLEGNITVTGCIIAAGDIWVNFFTRGTVTQSQVGDLPALMSRGGDISIWDPTTLTGLVYAADDITVFSQLGQTGDITINGQIISSGDTTMSDRATLNYVRQSPPGLGVTPKGWVLSWNE